MASSDCSRLVLGTAQLGMDYGVANTSGRPAADAALAMVRAAWEGGVREFDTAQDYGDAESVLGRVFSELGISDLAKVITKLAPGLDLHDQALVREVVGQSLRRLRQTSLSGLLLHREAYLDQWNDGLGDILAGLVSSGLVERIGVSVYTPESALKALKTEGVSLLQLPGNLFDRRFERAGVYDRAAEAGVDVHVRSVFLQGLALMESEQVPAGVEGGQAVVSEAEKLAGELGVSRVVLALAYVRHGLPGAKVLFGAETEAQVCENLELWRAEVPANLAERICERFSDVPETVLNPTLWNR